MEVSMIDAILWEVGNPLALFNSLTPIGVRAETKNSCSVGFVRSE
jgi:hypothetical protein